MRQALTWNPQAKKRGRPRNPLCKEVEAEMSKTEYKWKELSGGKESLMAYALPGVKRFK